MVRAIDTPADGRVILQLPRYEAQSRPPPNTSWLEHEGLCLQLIL